MRRSAALLAWAVLHVLGSTGCLSERCAPGQVLKNGICYEKQPDGATAPDGAEADGALESATGEGLANNLGAPCEDGSDCTGTATYCAVMPASTIGYCTFEDCTLEPDSCPDGYSCMEISRYVPGEPNLCIQM